jgi:hypothetical protein
MPCRHPRATRNEIGSEIAAIKTHAMKFSMVISPYWPAGSPADATSDGVPKSRVISGVRSS